MQISHCIAGKSSKRLEPPKVSMREPSKVLFKSVCEWSDAFLALFSHRFDYIWAEHPSLDAPVDWKTESRHPLSDRLIQQGAYLYGVRFGAETNYCLLDIDAGSVYHPQHDPFAISRMTAALESLGLVRYIACTSSYSSGLHLYFPFQHAQSSWQLAIALACVLENAGFKLQPGQLEVFPNPKPYSIDGTPSLFNAHRLPLQAGSYLLNDAFQPIWSDSHHFAKQWSLLQQCNVIDGKTLKQILKQVRRKHFGISGKAEKFVNDLNAEIELGWTGSGQTNRLLGRITMRAYIFHHMLAGGEPLKGAALVSEIVETARSLPGYTEWCNHQHEIEQRAEEWTRCIEGSHYFHFGNQPRKPKPEDPELIAAIDQTPSWNQRQAAATRDRIRHAIANLLETNQLPIRPTARFQALLTYGIGGASLYRHRDLWHPQHFGIDALPQEEKAELPVENPPDPPTLQTDSQLKSAEGASNWLSPPSLLSINGGDSLSARDPSHSTQLNTAPDASKLNAHPDSACLPSQARPAIQPTQQALNHFKAFQEGMRQTAAERQRKKAEAAQQRQRTRMQQFLDSGDRILMAEALAWAQVNPGVLQVKPVDQAQSCDRATLLVMIESQLRCLGWSATQSSQVLHQHFGKSHLALLSASELQRCLEWLSQKTGSERPQPLD